MHKLKKNIRKNGTNNEKSRILESEIEKEKKL